jgi:hypothetical protein
MKVDVSHVEGLSLGAVRRNQTIQESVMSDEKRTAQGGQQNPGQTENPDSNRLGRENPGQQNPGQANPGNPDRDFPGEDMPNEENPRRGNPQREDDEEE